MNQTVMAAVDWQVLLPLLGELAQMFLSDTVDWKRAIEIVVAIFTMFFEAEEVSGQAMDWSAIIKMLLALLQQFLNK